MPEIFQMIQTEYRLPASDFPNLDRFCQVVANMDFSTFPKFKPELFDALDEVLSNDIPEIMNMCSANRSIVQSMVLFIHSLCRSTEICCYLYLTNILYALQICMSVYRDSDLKIIKTCYSIYHLLFFL